MVSVCASVSGDELTPAELATLNTNINNRISVRLATPLCAALTLLEVMTSGLGTAGIDCQIVLQGKWWYAPSRPGSSQQMPSDRTVICRPLPPVGDCSLLELTCHFSTSGTSRRSKGHSPPTLLEPYFMDSPLLSLPCQLAGSEPPSSQAACWLGHQCWMPTSCSFCPATSPLPCSALKSPLPKHLSPSIPCPCLSSLK